MDTETVLCIFTYRRIFILDMERILLDEDHQDGTSPPLPPLLRIVDFLESELPLGMGLVKSGNFLYMFGGEYRGHGSDSPYFGKGGRREENPPDSICFYSMVAGAGLVGEDPPRPVYMLDLTDHRSEPVKLDNPMLGPKLYAVVEEIGGQIYVLSRNWLPSSGPLFEVWNPVTEKSRALPTAPSHSQGWNVRSHHVSGKIIVCWMGNFVYNCFDTASERWNSIKDLPYELNSLEIRDVRHRDVSYYPSDINGNLWAVRPAGGEACPHIELEFDISKTQPKISGFVQAGSVFLADTRKQGKYMCGLVPYASKYSFAFALYVFVFQLEKQLESELSVSYLRRQVYDFTNIKCGNEEFPLFCIREALVGEVLHNISTGSDESCRGEAKRKRDDDHDDEGRKF